MEERFFSSFLFDPVKEEDYNKASQIYKSIEKSKQNIKDNFFNGKKRLIFELEENSLELENERKFKQKLKEEYKARFGYENFLLFVSILNDSISVLDNKHSSGKKLTKVLKETLSDKEEVVLMYSQIKNSFICPKSLLVFSVAPIDFLNMGRGKGWSTCYDIGADNFIGTISSGLDKNSFLCYVTTAKENGLDLEYNKKLYRRLVILDEEQKNCKVSTEYPYKNNLLEKEIINRIQEIFNFSSFQRKNKTISIRKKRGSQVYNDFASSQQSKRSYLAIGNSLDKKQIITFGEKVVCPYCQQKGSQLNSLACYDCEVERLLDSIEKEDKYEDREFIY